MIYIIGSGFSGLVTAFALRKKYKNITIISPSKNKNLNKSSTLLKYLFNLTGEIKFNSRTVSKKIGLLEKNKYKNCKFISSYQDGGLSNIWGGVLSNVFQYNLKKFPFKLRDIERNKDTFLRLEKIIFKKNFKHHNFPKKIDSKLSLLNFYKKNNNVNNLKKYLLNKGIKFKYNLYLQKINYKNKEMFFYNLKSDKNQKINYKKLYISAGPVNTAKIILNSFKSFKSIKLRETRHFFCLVKKNVKSKNFKFFNFKHKNLKFYSQLYSFNEIINLLFNLKNFNLFKNFFIAQCYLDTKNSGYIEIQKATKSTFLMIGKEKMLFKKKLFNALNSYNKKSKNLKFFFPIFNSIGASNHIGGSFPMSNKKGKYNTKLNGQLYNFKNIYISDSSVLNEIDMQPITTFSLMNILRMNSKH